MPSKPQKITRPWVKERKPFERINANANTEFYNSRAWRKLSKQQKELHPLCCMCEREGFTTPAEIADHIIPINQGGASLDINNLQSLCKKHHNAKSANESRGAGGMG